MSPTYELPDHSRFRYKIQTDPAPGRPDLVEVSLWTYGYGGEQPRRAAVATSPAEFVPDALRRLLTVADAYDNGATGEGPIGDAARMLLAAGWLIDQHDRPPGRLDPADYEIAHHYLAQVLDLVRGFYQRMSLSAADFAGFCDAVDEQGGYEAWMPVRAHAEMMRSSLARAGTEAEHLAELLDTATGHSFTCGDCVEGICHWGGSGNPGGRLGTAQRAEASGERCGCMRHDVSVAMRRPDVESQGEMRLMAGVPRPAEQAEAGRIIGAWYARHVDPAVGLVGRVAAWASGAGGVPVADIADELTEVFQSENPGALGELERRLGSPPVVLERFDDDVAEHMLNGFYPSDPRHLLEPGTWFVNRHGRPLPRYGMDGGPEQLDDAELAQVAREVYAKLRAELGDADTLGSIADVGAAVFDIPGRGPLLVPADADLAMICIRLHVSVAFERETRPDDVVIIDDPVRPTDPPAAVLDKLRARGMTELGPRLIAGAAIAREATDADAARFAATVATPGEDVAALAGAVAAVEEWAERQQAGEDVATIGEAREAVDQFARDLDSAAAVVPDATGHVRELQACGKPDCERLVPVGTVHCCTPCATAAEGRYEIDQHSDGCERRWAERRPAPASPRTPSPVEMVVDAILTREGFGPAPAAERFPIPGRPEAEAWGHDTMRLDIPGLGDKPAADDPAAES